MVAVIVAPQAPLVAQAEPGIAAYLAAGDHMAMIMGVTMKVCAVLLPLVVVAWALLPKVI